MAPDEATEVNPSEDIKNVSTRQCVARAPFGSVIEYTFIIIARFNLIVITVMIVMIGFRIPFCNLKYGSNAIAELRNTCSVFYWGFSVTGRLDCGHKRQILLLTARIFIICSQ